jgi:PST family polysaccharide transporter
LNSKDVSVGKKLTAALGKSITGRYIFYATQLISMMYMARLFTPEEFGLYAAIQVFAIFFLLFSEVGLVPALINEKTVKPAMRDGIFTITAGLGLAVGIVFVAFSPILSWFYDNKIYLLLSIPVSISIFFNTICIVPLASLQKEKRFISIARTDCIAELASLIIVVLLTSVIEPILVLAIKPLSTSIMRFSLLLLSSRHTQIGRPYFGKEIGAIKKLLSFTSYQAGFNFLNYFSRNLDNILVGKYFGAVSLGVYDKAYQLMRYPLLLLTFAMSPAIQPVLTEIKHDKIEFERLHNKFVKYICYLGLIAGVSIYFFSELIVLIILGEQWDKVIPLLKILSLTVPIQVVLSSSGGFFQAAGRVDLMFKCGVFSAFVNVLFISIGISNGDIITLCWLLVLSFNINFLQCYYILSSNLLVNGFRGFIKSVSYPLLLVLFFITFVLIENY